MKAISNAVRVKRVDFSSVQLEVASFLNDVGFTDTQYCFIGSFGKKESCGDVDVAVLATVKSMDDVKKYLVEHRIFHRVFTGFRQLSIGLPTATGLVQLDMMFSNNLEWSRFIYNSPDLINGNFVVGGESFKLEYSGIYRNLLLNALIVKHFHQTLAPNFYRCGIIRLFEGISVSTRERDGNKVTTLSTKFVTDSPTEISALLNIPLDAFDSFETLYIAALRVGILNPALSDFIRYCLENKLDLPKFDYLNNIVTTAALRVCA